MSYLGPWTSYEQVIYLQWTSDLDFLGNSYYMYIEVTYNARGVS